MIPVYEDEQKNVCYGRRSAMILMIDRTGLKGQIAYFLIFTTDSDCFSEIMQVNQRGYLSAEIVLSCAYLVLYRKVNRQNVH